MPPTALPLLDDEPSRHSIGGNGPPDPVELLRADLMEADALTRAKLMAGAHEVLLTFALLDDENRAAERKVLTEAFARTPEKFPTEDVAGRGANFAARINRSIKAEEDAREAAKRPYLEGGRRIDHAFKLRRTPLESFVTAIKSRIAAFQRRKAEEEAAERRRLEEEQRRALAQAQELERRQREVQEAAAAGAPVDPQLLAEDADKAAQLRQDADQAGAASVTLSTKPESLRTDHNVLATPKQRLTNVRIVDANAVPDRFWIVDVAAVMAVIRAGEQVPGIEPIWEDTVIIR